MKFGTERIYNKSFTNKNKVVLWEVLTIKKEQDLNIKFISTNSSYRQGIRIAVDVGEGYVEINGLKAKQLYLWEDTAPKNVHVKCISNEGLLSIYNVFDLGENRGGKREQMDSSGMIIERMNDILEFRCNDAGFQTNFDKLVFHVRML